MHLASVVDELTFVVETFFGEPSDFLGVCCVESDGVGGVILLGHGQFLAKLQIDWLVNNVRIRRAAPVLILQRQGPLFPLCRMLLNSISYYLSQHGLSTFLFCYPNEHL